MHDRLEGKMKLLFQIKIGLLQREKQTKLYSQIWAKSNMES